MAKSFALLSLIPYKNESTDSKGKVYNLGHANTHYTLANIFFHGSSNFIKAKEKMINAYFQKHGKRTGEIGFLEHVVKVEHNVCMYV